MKGWILFQVTLTEIATPEARSFQELQKDFSLESEASLSYTGALAAAHHDVGLRRSLNWEGTRYISQSQHSNCELLNTILNCGESELPFSIGALEPLSHLSLLSTKLHLRSDGSCGPGLCKESPAVHYVSHVSFRAKKSTLSIYTLRCQVTASIPVRRLGCQHFALTYAPFCTPLIACKAP